MKRRLFTKIGSMVFAAMYAASVAAGAVTPFVPVVHAAEASAPDNSARAVELGIGALSNPVSNGGEWDGSFVYFGNQGNYPICFRVLDTDSKAYGSDSVLLDANYALSRTAFDKNGSVDWSDSDLRKYLNSEFLMGNFSQTERNAILPSVKNGSDGASSLNGDYVFVLDQAEAQNQDYGYGDYGTLTKENMRFNATDAEYALRSSINGQIQTVDATGGISSAGASDMIYYSPALNMNAEDVAFTYPAEDDKPAYLAPVGAADDNYYKLTMKGGDGFAAKRKDNADNAVPAGYGFLVDVQDVGSAEKGVNYSRISGMLVDATGNVASYGMLSDIAATGEVLVNVPASTPAGDYTLYVFAEDVKSDYYDHATDYASNFAPIKVHVDDANAVSEEAVQAIEKQNAEKTEAVQAKTQKSDQQTKPQAAQQAQTQKQSTQKQQKQQTQQQTQQKTAPQAVAHKINLNTEGNGKVQASVQSATVGTVIVMTPTPDNGWHFKGWQSSDVSVAADNKFTMPDKDITVKAIFEKNANTHAIKLAYMERSTVELSATNAPKGTKVKAKCKPVAGNHFVRWEVEGLSYDPKSENPLTFTMPDNDVLIKAVCEEDKAQEYTITMKVNGQGSAAAAYNKAQANVWVNLSANPAEGWRFVRWDSNEVNPGGQSKFLMPAKNVTLTAVFEKIPESSFAVSTVIRGEGGKLWTTAANGTPKTSFTRGEKVVVQTQLENKYKLNSLKADGVDLTKDSTTGAIYFYMPNKSVTLTAVFEREAEKEHEAYLVVSGDGNAWTQNAKGENVRYFKEGERVYIQTMSHNAQVESIQSRDVKIEQASGAYDAYFDMPAGGATVYVAFKTVETEYDACINVSGNGGAWTTDASNNAKTSFKAGERVYIQTVHNESELESIRSNDVAIGPGNDKYDGYFDMPRGGATIRVSFKNAAPAPDPTYTITFQCTGDGSAWATNANGESKSTFKAGDKVLIQTVHNSADIKSISAGNVQISPYNGTDGAFDMPAGDVTVKIVFEAQVRDYAVSIASLQGPGNVYPVDGSGASRNRFQAGEQVILALNGEEVTWDSYSSNDPAVAITTNGRGQLIFNMPAHDLQLMIVTKSTAVEHHDEPDPAAISTVGDDGEIDSFWDDDDFDFE
ncbi:MAG: DUF6273 domain-containing protein [Lachnospiraceae bacterium]|nr:DUF6273 domain-containing protein [Lachnospiraceae bacterium]